MDDQKDKKKRVKEIEDKGRLRQSVGLPYGGGIERIQWPQKSPPNFPALYKKMNQGE